MIRAILIISLVIAVGARHHFNRATADTAKEPHNLGWLFAEDSEHAESASNESKPERSVCQTKECHLMAKKLLESMNRSADPCEDFYEYTCGNWAKHNEPTVNGLDRWNLLMKLTIQVTSEIGDMLKSPAESDDFLGAKLIKKWYKSCMDTDAIEKRGLDPLLSILGRIGGWPITMESMMWDEDVYTWQKVDDYYSRLTGENIFYSLGVVSAEGTPLIGIDSPNLPINSYKIYTEVNGDDDDDEDDSEDESSDEDDSEDDSDDESSDEDDSEDRSGDGDDSEDESSDEDDSEDESGDDDDDDDSNDDSDSDSDDESTSENIIEGDSVSDEQKIRLTNRKKSRINRKKHGDKNGIVIKTAKRKTKQVAHKNKTVANKKKTVHKKAKNSRHVRKEALKLLKKRTKRSLSPRIIHHLAKNHGPIKHKRKLTEKRGLRKGRHNKLNSDEIELTTEATNEESDEDEDSDEDDDMPKLRQYAEYMSQVVVAFAEEMESDLDLDDLHDDIRDIILFQLELHRLTISEDYDNMTLDAFQEWYDDLKGDNPNAKVNWADKIEDLFYEANVDIDGSQIAVVNTKYFKGLKKLLCVTPSRTLVNYIHWFYMSQMLITSTEKMRNLFHGWSGRNETTWLQKHMRCTRERKIQQVVAYEYVKKHFTDDMQKFALDLIDDIQKEVEYEIKDAKWMDEDTRDSVLSKLVRMERLVGYPDWYKNETLVKQHLKGITIGLSYLENMLNYGRFTKWEDLRELVKGSEDSSDGFAMNPTGVNAAFLREDNSIIITAADFQSPLFAFGRPSTVNFALIGSIMAHEVNHGFDNGEHSIDKDGNEMEWLAEVTKAYGKRAECFIHQYNKYGQNLTSNEITVYGNQTLDENIADTMGVQAVYKAHKRRQRECGKDDDALPGMEDFSNDQIFFLSYGYTWCEWLNSTLQASNMKNDEHSIGRLRVIGPVSNLEEFANAFNCPIDSPMNPKKKCNIWK